MFVLHVQSLTLTLYFPIKYQSSKHVENVCHTSIVYMHVHMFRFINDYVYVMLELFHML